MSIVLLDKKAKKKIPTVYVKNHGWSEVSHCNFSFTEKLMQPKICSVFIYLIKLVMTYETPYTCVSN